MGRWCVSSHFSDQTPSLIYLPHSHLPDKLNSSCVRVWHGAVNDDRDFWVKSIRLPCVRVSFLDHHSLGFSPELVHNRQHIYRFRFSNRHYETSAVLNTTADGWTWAQTKRRLRPIVASLGRRSRREDLICSLLLEEVQEPKNKN